MMPSAEPRFSDMLDGGCNWRNRSELLGVLMRWNPNTTSGSRFFVTKAEYRVSALDGCDGYGSDAEYVSANFRPSWCGDAGVCAGQQKLKCRFPARKRLGGELIPESPCRHEAFAKQ